MTSQVLVQIVRGDSYLFRSWNPAAQAWVSDELDFGCLMAEGGDAELEHNEGLLEDGIVSFLPKEPGWYLLEGFKSNYFETHEGDFDVNPSVSHMRKARWTDVIRFGAIQKMPWYVSFAWEVLLYDPVCRVKEVPCQTAL